MGVNNRGWGGYFCHHVCLRENVTLLDHKIYDAPYLCMQGKQRKKFLKYHLALQMLATAAIAGGFYAIYSNKVIANKAHFTSSHAKLSLVVLVASLLVQIGGVFSFFGLPKALKKHTALVNKTHKMVRNTH